MASYTRAVKKILSEHDCCYHRSGKGDHEIWYSPVTDRYFTVDHNILSRHTANGIMKQAGVDHHF